MRDAYTDYKALLDRFMEKAIPVEEFQTIYLELFKNETRQLSEPLFALLDGLFGDIDSFSADPYLLAEQPDYYIDEAQLREKVKVVANRLSFFE